MPDIKKLLRGYISALFLIILCSNILEAFGFAIIPVFFASIFIEEKFIFENKFLDHFSNLIKIPSLSKTDVLIWICLLFVSKNLILIIAEYFKFNIFYKVKIFLAEYLYDSYLKSNLIAIKQKNSSEISRNFLSEINLTAHYFMNFATMFQEITIVILLFIILAMINFNLSIFLLVIITLFGILINFSVIKKIKNYSSKSLVSRFLFLNSIKQNLESIKEIKVFGKYGFFKNIFFNNFKINEKSQVGISFFQNLPKFILEIMFVLVICGVLLLFINKDYEGSVRIGEVILFTVMTVRLVPSFNRLNFSINFHFQTKISKESIFNDLKNFKKEKKGESNFFYKKIDSLGINKVSFKYKEKKKKEKINTKVFELKNINLKFKKSQISSIIGSSGSGKTTIINILCGLLLPDKGNYIINSKKFKFLPKNVLNNISYLPQQIFLLDDTIKKNIAFGEKIDQIDEVKINKVINSVDLKNFINSLPNKLDTKVGERGGILSGGQLQRIGIARALYFEKDIIILDEPTSSLDENNSKNIIKTLHKIKKDKIIILVTHYLKMASQSDQVFLLEDGKIINFEKNFNLIR